MSLSTGQIIECFKTIQGSYGPAEFKEKGSRFVSFAYEINSVEQAEQIIKKLKKQFYSATHVCSAYRLGQGREDIFRYNDEGEPSGTAGLPIYNEIKGMELFNILVASVRYYGGTKLGTGGLTRAYGRSAKLILDEVSIVQVEIKKQKQLSVSFDFIGDMMYLINSVRGIDIIEQNYHDQGCFFVIAIPIAQVKTFDSILMDKSSGKYTILKPKDS